MTSDLTPRRTPARKLDVNRCAQCGASSADEIRTIGDPIQVGRVAMRYRVCDSCGWGRASEAVTVSYVLTGNPAAVEAMDKYMEVAKERGEETIEFEGEQ